MAMWKTSTRCPKYRRSPRKHIFRASLFLSRNFADHREKHIFWASLFLSCWLTYCYFSVPCTFTWTIGGDHWKIVMVGITRNNSVIFLWPSLAERQGRMSEDKMSEDKMSEDLPESMPQDMPEGMSDDLPDKMSKDSHGGDHSWNN